MSKIAITTECVSDLPVSLIKEKNIGYIYFDIHTDKGVFQDTTEISERNILEYMAGGDKKAQSEEPLVADYMNLFKNALKEYDEVIHICVSGKISKAIMHARMAKMEMKEEGEKIHIIDSKHLSSGMGLLVLRAAQYRDEGLGCEEIIKKIKNLRSKISTSFITRNADYLSFNGRISGIVARLCHRLALHPVLAMKDGALVLQNIMIGNYDNACSKYVDDQLKNSAFIDDEIAFITHAGCSNSRMDYITDRVEKRVAFKKIVCQPASAAVSVNCGPDTFGVLYIKKGKV